MHASIVALEKERPFRFTCSPEVACFNACCHDLQQALTPYDVLCLKQFLGMPSNDFLSAYTDASVGPETGLPVVSLRFRATEDLACPFVSDSGCRVYPARPASCRTYPLARGVARDRKTGRLTEHWAVIHEPHCQGFEAGALHTVDAWVEDQQIAAHNRMNDKMLDLISHKNRCRPGPLSPDDYRSVFRALYDLDTFRDRYSNALGDIAPYTDPRDIERAGSDDVALLHIAITWIRRTVFTDVEGGT